MNILFSLRNQSKIEKSLGIGFLNLLLSELRKDCDLIEYDSDKYKFIIVGNYEFYVIKKLYGCYNLAYKPK